MCVCERVRESKIDVTDFLLKEMEIKLERERVREREVEQGSDIKGEKETA